MSKGAALLLVLILAASAAITLPPVNADYGSLVEIVPMEHGYIRSDGTIEPSTLPIERSGNFYLLKGNIVNYTIEIQKSNIVFDGNGFTLALPQSAYTTMPGKYGPALMQIINGSNIVVQNTTFSTYYQGISVTNSSRITILGNGFTNGRGSIILRSCSNCDILGNNLTENSSGGLSALDSTYLNIAYNNMTRNQNGGCLLQGVTYSNITRNNIVDNSLGDLSGNGIYAIIASNNRFFENNFIHNPTAIIFTGDYNSSVNNLIYQNYFQDNDMDILNIGGDAGSAVNESPLKSPAPTSYEPQLRSAPAENSTSTDPSSNYDLQTTAILTSLTIITTLLVAGFWYYRRRHTYKYTDKDY